MYGPVRPSESGDFGSSTGKTAGVSISKNLTACNVLYIEDRILFILGDADCDGDAGGESSCQSLVGESGVFMLLCGAAPLASSVISACRSWEPHASLKGRHR
jgi:hypothetical protein